MLKYLSSDVEEQDLKKRLRKVFKLFLSKTKKLHRELINYSRQCKVFSGFSKKLSKKIN